MKLLAIDTSTNYLSLAVTDDEKVLGRVHRRADMSHSTLLVPMVDALLKKARLTPKDIDLLCLSIGPGSFTGLRIGVVTVKGLAYSLDKPVVAVPTLDVIARNAKNFSGVICPVLDARKNKVYACLYSSDGKTIKRISKYLLLSVEELLDKTEAIGSGKVMFMGDYAPRISPAAGVSYSGDWHPKAAVVAKLGLEYSKKKKFVTPEDLEPLYMYSRECDIKGI